MMFPLIILHITTLIKDVQDLQYQREKQSVWKWMLEKFYNSVLWGKSQKRQTGILQGFLIVYLIEIALG